MSIPMLIGTAVISCVLGLCVLILMAACAVPFVAVAIWLGFTILAWLFGEERVLTFFAVIPALTIFFGGFTLMGVAGLGVLTLVATALFFIGSWAVGTFWWLASMHPVSMAAVLIAGFITICIGMIALCVCAFIGSVLGTIALGIVAKFIAELRTMRKTRTERLEQFYQKRNRKRDEPESLPVAA